ncbi:MAG: amidohydrolase, partial [Saprospiraceae bacterium]|nr:amidohydrolase [Saprospiraceae bacterium]
MTFYRILSACLLFLAGITVSVAAQEVEVIKPESGSFALTNARLVTVTDGTIENGTLLIQDGKITALGTTVAIPEGFERIDCSGMEVYPGMIDGGTRLGLIEVGSISLTQDYNEVGEVTPHMQALTAVNPNSVAIPVTRVNGVTTVLTAPGGGVLPGTAATINLLGYSPQQMYSGFKGLVLNFP